MLKASPPPFPPSQDHTLVVVAEERPGDMPSLSPHLECFSAVGAPPLGIQRLGEKRPQIWVCKQERKTHICRKTTILWLVKQVYLSYLSKLSSR